MNLKKHFETATEKFEFTVDLGGWRKKKVLEFHPSTGKYSDSLVSELSLFGKSMNVNSITKGGIMLYSFDILDNQITAKIKWENVELGNTLDVLEEIPGFEGTKETLDNLSIFG